MVARIKTTIELPDALAEEAKALARDQNVTLRELMVSGLRSELERRSAAAPRADFQFATYGGGGLQPGVKWADVIEMSYER